MHKAPGVGWNQDHPQSITDDGVKSIIDALGTLGTPKRRLAFGFTISYNSGPNETAVAESVVRLLALSQKYDLPIVLCLDGFEWWGTRSELWNWFDPKLPNYNPDNVNNVEWTDWTPVNGTTISWRDWGAQFRVPQPHPNIMSPKFIKSNTDRLERLVPIVTQWYKALPADKKYLLAALKVGWEIWIGTNYYYYKNGNDLRNKDPKLVSVARFCSNLVGSKNRANKYIPARFCRSENCRYSCFWLNHA